MNTYSTLNLGNFPSTQTAITLPAMVFPFSGNFSIEALINGQFYINTLAGTAGNPIVLVNGYANDATVMVRIKLPIANRTDTNSYINDPSGHIWFQWTNIPAWYVWLCYKLIRPAGVQFCRFVRIVCVRGLDSAGAYLSKIWQMASTEPRQALV